MEVLPSPPSLHRYPSTSRVPALNGSQRNDHQKELIVQQGFFGECRRGRCFFLFFFFFNLCKKFPLEIHQEGFSRVVSPQCCPGLVINILLLPVYLKLFIFSLLELPGCSQQ